jgi:hypothetical protein
LQRKPKAAAVARLRKRDNDEFANLRRQAARWTADNFEKLTDPDPSIPDELNDRAADNWRPLLAIADLAGGQWPKRAREEARLLSGEGHESSSLNVELLADIQKAFGGRDAMSSADLVAALIADKECPWADWKHGQPLTQRQLANLLRPFGIISQTLHIPGVKDAKGYTRTAFETSWAAYLPNQSAASRQSTPSETSKRPNADGIGTSRDLQSVRGESQDGSKNADLANSHVGLDAWTLRKADPVAQGEFGQGRAVHLCDHCGGMATLADPLNTWDWSGALMASACINAARVPGSIQAGSQH